MFYLHSLITLKVFVIGEKSLGFVLKPFISKKEILKTVYLIISATCF